MQERSNRLISPKGLLLDFALAAIWFLFFAWELRPNVPSSKEPYITFFALSTAACLTAVFWLGLCMFRVVRVDHGNKELEE